MKIIIENPTKAYIQDATYDELQYLKKQLTYTNTSAQHQVKRLYNNHWFRNGNPEKWKNDLEVLKKTVHNCLVFEEGGKVFIRPGSITYIEDLNFEVVSRVNYPIPKKVAWSKPLPFNLYPYQEESWQKLIDVRHGNVSLATGSGKSGIILKLCREMGLNTIVIAPSKSIFLELLDKFEFHFGKGNVGAFGAGKKRLGKKFTVCINDSLVNVRPDTKEWELLSGADVLIVDESHTFASDTLEQVCHGLCANIPYRFYFSATQTRGDGSLKLLQSIIGKTVNNLSTKQAVDGGYICPHSYRIVEVESGNPNFQVSDVLEMKRHHVLRNPNIANFIAKVANADAMVNGKQTLILVEELNQISMLSSLLKVPFAIAHSESSSERLSYLGIEKVDVAESIQKFNKNEVKVLIGTSCIHVGVNIFPTHNCFWWAGGASEIRVRQGAIGRAIRLGNHNPWANKCKPKPQAIIWDFDVSGIYALEAHLRDRLEFYSDSGSEIKYIKTV